MNILENLTEDNKNLIKFIIDGYDETIESISKGINSAVAGHGVLFNQVIGDSNCLVDLGSLDGLLALKLTYSSKKRPPTDTFEYIRASELICSRARLNVFEQLVFLKSLYEQNLIIFSEEAQLSLEKFSINDAERQWHKENSLHCSIWYIQSPELLSFVRKYSQSHILPTKALRNYKDNGYKTEEQKKFCYSQRTSIVAIVVAILIAILSPILTQKFTDNSPIELNNTQFNAILDSLSYINESCSDIRVYIKNQAQDSIKLNNGKITNEKR
ncbi:MAG: hypothetical protein K2L14_00965 [Duncaniella sp.]|nr:hypothetical protein [Duncaniella sp.]